MPASEFAEWKVYFSGEPMVDFYWICGQICLVIAIVMGSGKTKWKREDFMPLRRKYRQSAEESLRSFKAPTGE